MSRTTRSSRRASSDAWRRSRGGCASQLGAGALALAGKATDLAGPHILSMCDKPSSFTLRQVCQRQRLQGGGQGAPGEVDGGPRDPGHPQGPGDAERAA